MNRLNEYAVEVRYLLDDIEPSQEEAVSALTKAKRIKEILLPAINIQIEKAIN